MTSNHAPDPTAASRADWRLRLQKALLRFTAIILFTGLPGALLPGIAAEKFSWLMDLGQPPLGPLMIYLSGNAGFIYVVLGVLVWAISNDPVRHRPLVVLMGWLLVIGGPAYLSIDLQAGLPAWWIALDSVACLAVGSGILWACRLRPSGQSG